MIEPVSAYAVRPPTIEAAPVDPGLSQPGRVDPATQQEFESLMRPDEIQVAQAGNAQAATTANPWIVQPGPAEVALPPVPSLGETISDSLQGLREHWTATRQAMSAALDAGSVSNDQLMNLSMQFQQSSMMVTVLMNEVNVLNQEVSKLMRAS